MLLVLIEKIITRGLSFNLVRSLIVYLIRAYIFVGKLVFYNSIAIKSRNSAIMPIFALQSIG